MLNANDSVRGNLATLKDNGVKIGKDRVAKLLKQLSFNLRVNFEGKVDINECSVSTLQKRTCETINNVSGSNCPQDKVTDTITIIDNRESIIYKDGTIGTLTNQPSNTPTQSDIIDEMEAYLMQLEDEIKNT